MKKIPRGMGDPNRRSTARAVVRVRKGTWNYWLIDSEGKVVGWDNTNDWRTVFEGAFEGVRALRNIENRGHRLIRNYDFLVDHT